MKRVERFKKYYESVLRKNISGAKKIEIDIAQEGRNFISKIKLTSEGYVFWASKSGSSVDKSLRKTGQAIIRQAEKRHGKKMDKIILNRPLLAYESPF